MEKISRINKLNEEINSRLQRMLSKIEHPWYAFLLITNIFKIFSDIVSVWAKKIRDMTLLLLEQVLWEDPLLSIWLFSTLKPNVLSSSSLSSTMGKEAPTLELELSEVPMCIPSIVTSAFKQSIETGNTLRNCCSPSSSSTIPSSPLFRTKHVSSITFK